MTDSGKAITMRSGAASGPPEMTTEPIATSAEIYGRLREGAHFAGYSFERACTHLEWLLEADRWTLGGRYDDVNKFLESIKLDQFRVVAEQRKRIAQCIKALQPAVSNRAIAKVIGVDRETIRADLGREGWWRKFATDRRKRQRTRRLN